MKKKNLEPQGAFPYKPPSEDIKEKYKDLFCLTGDIKPKFSKIIFDKSFSFFCLIFFIPILIILKIAYVLEGILIQENKGPMLYFYYGVSAGKKFKKYKLRVIKQKFIDHEAAKKGDWIAYSSEWNEESRTIVGKFVKDYYLDEIPQFFSVFLGDMSFVGPRPLSVMHYERDIEQGNITRRLLRGGILGLGHINKGTSEMGNPVYEYEYLRNNINMSSFQLLRLDLWIIYKGLILVLKGGGH